MLLPYSVEFTAGILDILQSASRQDSVLIFFVVGLNIEVDGAIAFISEPVVKNLLYELLLFYDMYR